MKKENKDGLVVLSLFDGMACGLVALKRAGIPVKKYYASEIDKYAIQVAKKNHPEIEHIGDVTLWDWWNIEKPDLIIGGSPCQGFSFAGKQLAFDDPRSKLFFTMIDIINHYKHINPDIKYLLENVRMKKEYLGVITDYMGVDPLFIDSNLVSAQNRKRFYWFNWDAKEPEDRGIFLKDIVESGVVDRDKSFCIDANYWKGGNLKTYYKSSRRQVVFEAKNKKKVEIDLENLVPPLTFYETRTEFGKQLRREARKKLGRDTTPRGPTHKKYVPLLSGKANCLVTVDSQLNWIIDKDFYVRKLTPVECERLQTLPDNYTEGVSNTQKYKMLGNGWTVDVVSNLFEQGLK